jgi:hypothetical protein
MAIDVVIPYQPRQVGTAATMGTPASIANGGFRNGILSLAREVAFVGDSSQSAKPQPTGPFGLGKLFDKLSGRAE